MTSQISQVKSKCSQQDTAGSTLAEGEIQKKEEADLGNPPAVSTVDAHAEGLQPDAKAGENEKAANATKKPKNEDILSEARIHSIYPGSRAEELVALKLGARELKRHKAEDYPRFVKVFKIDADENELGLEAFNAFPALQELHLCYNRVTNIPDLSGLFPHLLTLDLSYNNLTTQDVDALSHLNRLRDLRLSGNELRRLPRTLEGRFPELRELHLDHNHLSRPETFWVLSELARLESLDLDANGIARLPKLRRDTGDDSGEQNPATTELDEEDDEEQREDVDAEVYTSGIKEETSGEQLAAEEEKAETSTAGEKVAVVEASESPAAGEQDGKQEEGDVNAGSGQVSTANAGRKENEEPVTLLSDRFPNLKLLSLKQNLLVRAADLLKLLEWPSIKQVRVDMDAAQNLAVVRTAFGNKGVALEVGSRHPGMTSKSSHDKPKARMLTQYLRVYRCDDQVLHSRGSVLAESAKKAAAAAKSVAGTDLPSERGAPRAWKVLQEEMQEAIRRDSEKFLAAGAGLEDVLLPKLRQDPETPCTSEMWPPPALSDGASVLEEQLSSHTYTSDPPLVPTDDVGEGCAKTGSGTSLREGTDASTDTFKTLCNDLREMMSSPTPPRGWERAALRRVKNYNAQEAVAAVEIFPSYSAFDSSRSASSTKTTAAMSDEELFDRRVRRAMRGFAWPRNPTASPSFAEESAPTKEELMEERVWRAVKGRWRDGASASRIFSKIDVVEKKQQPETAPQDSIEERLRRAMRTRRLASKQHQQSPQTGVAERSQLSLPVQESQNSIRPQGRCSRITIE